MLDKLLLATQGTGVDRPSMEHLWCSPHGFGVTTATPLQRALCRFMSDEPLAELAELAVVRRALGVQADYDMRRVPVANAELLLLAGIRTGKSMLSSLAAFHWARYADISHLSAGEMARVSVVSMTKDLANVVFGHLVGNLMARPGLKRHVVAQPESGTLHIRHETGKVVEIKVVAGTRAGASLVARWSAGCIFDEAPRMVGADEGVVNLEDCRRAVLGRIIPGAKLMMIGSPWLEFGPAYTMFREGFGHPGARGTLVVRARAPDLNPVYWTEERCATLKANDPDVHATDVEAMFGSGDESMFSTASIARALRVGQHELPYLEGYDHVAAMDPATRGNAWTLVIARRTRENLVEVVLAKEWIGSKHCPLDPAVVLREIAEHCGRFGTTHALTDQWSFDSLRSTALGLGLHLTESFWGGAGSTWELYKTVGFLLDNGHLSLPEVENLREDLSAVSKRSPLRPGGAPVIQLPRNGKGRHCDYAPALMLACGGFVPPPSPKEPSAIDPGEEMERQQDEQYRQERLMGEEMGVDYDDGW